MTDKEREQWIELAEMVGFRAEEDTLLNITLISTETNLELLLCGVDATRHHIRETQSTLIGLACRECNGSVYQFVPTNDWIWEIRDESGEIAADDGAATQSEALLTMLKLYREMPGVGNE